MNLNTTKKNKSPLDHTIRQAAITMVCVNAMTLEVCDSLTSTGFYKHDVKQLINTLTKKLEDHTKQFYSFMTEEEELEYYALQDLLKKGMYIVATLNAEELEEIVKLIESKRTEFQNKQTQELLAPQL